MAYTNYLEAEYKNNSSKYVKCLAEGIHDWIDVKEKSGNTQIIEFRSELEKEISSSHKKTTPEFLLKTIARRMEMLGIGKDLLMEFKGVFIV